MKGALHEGDLARSCRFEALLLGYLSLGENGALGSAATGSNHVYEGFYGADCSYQALRTSMF